MNISFRFKIQIAVLLILSLVVSLYVFLATSWYKNEKKLSVYETMSLQNSLSTVELSGVIGNIISESKQIVAIYAAEADRAKEIFSKQSAISGIYVTKNNEPFVDLNKNAMSQPDHHKPVGQKLILQPNTKSSFAITDISNDYLQIQRLEKDEENNEFGTTITFPQNLVNKYLPSDSAMKSYVTNMEGKLLATNTTDTDLLKNVSTNLSRTQVDVLQEIKMGEDEYIMAINSFPNLPLKIVSLIDKKVALAPLKILIKKSLFFFVFVMGLAGIISLIIGISLTQKLILLTDQTKQIAEGNLDVVSEIKSTDEIGQLSKSIATMASSLKNYIHELVSKSRMEAELQTARAVQETLFPQSDNDYGGIHLTGFFESASETGGDWWFTWKVGNEVFFLIADATGHGAPAALITSAARSCIALMQKNETSDIYTIATSLDHVIRETSKGQILMTAFICKVNFENLKVTYVNCSHEPCLIFREGDEEIRTAFEPISPRLGDSSGIEFGVGEMSLQDGDHVILYTDGFSEVENKDGQRLSERRIHKLILDIFINEPNALEAIKKLTQRLKDFMQQPLNDDMTMVHVKVKWDTPFTESTQI
ncbi:MAG: SpoIIE family protein phosphatase [Bdellovibrionales bacterium]|nr:SpoIIE family protein phosphatase [Bdellovibrionales bacterium]